MPTYESKCNVCNTVFEFVSLLSERNNPRPCPHCSSENTERIISQCGFILQGDNWPGKAIRVAGQMSNKNRRQYKRQEEKKREATMNLAPNVEGEKVDSWREAQKLAASKGKDTNSYEPMIKQEEDKKKSIKISD
jgi:putative FmdB family regulatory protein